MVGVVVGKTWVWNRLLGRLGLHSQTGGSRSNLPVLICARAESVRSEKECLIGLPIPMMTATDV